MIMKEKERTIKKETKLQKSNQLLERNKTMRQKTP